MMTKFWRYVARITAALGACGGFTVAAYASNHQPLASIVETARAASEQRAKNEGYEQVSVEVRPLDTRLRLRACDQPLSTFSPQASQVLGSVSVGVRCSDAKPWTIYVRTQVTAMRSVPVLTKSLPRYTVISAADIKLVNRPLQSATNGLIYDPSEIIGKEITRQLDAGTALRVNQLRAPKAIKRGQQVTLITGLNGLEVRNQGRALRDAVAGARVTVKNLSSGKQIEGIARSDGTVSVQ